MPSSAWKKKGVGSEEHTSELQSHDNHVCRLLLEKKEAERALGREREEDRGLKGDNRDGHTWYVAPDLEVVRAVGEFVFFNDAAPTEIFTLPPPDRLPV